VLYTNNQINKQPKKRRNKLSLPVNGVNPQWLPLADTHSVKAFGLALNGFYQPGFDGDQNTVARQALGGELAQEIAVATNRAQ
jgi:hypothetical protein